MLGVLKWLNPIYPIWKLSKPLARNPSRTLAIASKPVASASSMLLARNNETLTLQNELGEVTIKLPYDTRTLERTLAISLLPQVMIMQHLYAIPEIQAEINALWRTLTANKVKGLPRWRGIRSLFNKKAAELAEKRLVAASAARVGGQVGARATGAFIPFLNVAIFIDTGILLATGLGDLILSEEFEENIGIDIRPFSPIGEAITGLAGFVGNQLGISEQTILNAAEDFNLDTLTKGGLVLLGDLVIDEIEDLTINLDLDGKTFGQIIGLAIQISAVQELFKIQYTMESMIEFFIISLLSFIIVFYSLKIIRWFKSSK